MESEFDRGISDNYTLALVTYSLSSVRSPKAKDALNMLTWRAEQEGNVCNPFCVMKCVNDVRKFCTPGAKLITFMSSEWDENEMRVRSILDKCGVNSKDGVWGSAPVCVTRCT